MGGLVMSGDFDVANWPALHTQSTHHKQTLYANVFGIEKEKHSHSNMIPQKYKKASKCWVGNYIFESLKALFPTQQ